MGDKRGSYRILVGKTDGNRALVRLGRKLEDNIKMDLQGVGWGGLDWTDLAQVRDRWRVVVNAVMNFRVSKVRVILD
jgi:hypothetical protein